MAFNSRLRRWVKEKKGQKVHQGARLGSGSSTQYGSSAADLSSRLFQAWRTAARGASLRLLEEGCGSSCSAWQSTWAAGATGRGVSSSNSGRSPANHASPTQGGLALRTPHHRHDRPPCVGQRHAV
jgi:hypothetical protein